MFHNTLYYNLDMKPSNILLDQNYNVIISDYYKKILIKPNDILFNSPEEIKGEEIDESCDIWSFGCLIYYFYTGKAPFIYDKIDNIALLRFKETDNPELNTILSKTLIHEKKLRINVDDLIKEIKSIITVRSISLTPINIQEKEDKQFVYLKTIDTDPTNKELETIGIDLGGFKSEMGFISDNNLKLYETSTGKKFFLYYILFLDVELFL